MHWKFSLCIHIFEWRICEESLLYYWAPPLSYPSVRLTALTILLGSQTVGSLLYVDSIYPALPHPAFVRRSPALPHYSRWLVDLYHYLVLSYTPFLMLCIALALALWNVNIATTAPLKELLIEQQSQCICYRSHPCHCIPGRTVFWLRQSSGIIS